ncbi:Sodium-coupled monocarboxylate transporter 1 Electrogenic sodium monocarboxylate cotransporter [Channa argus]|uniref:Sodium-coupled monocarboxylate transporter 1 Electrogenic sodium monocarboxylate cotransporter n=1 Tax=Channa argus TaxID=215402 RepID=A0A6G1QQH4_CHAAH|nr:Sodium-coupled monocarboxylate transporter 1 Electrogenic sodium monocarboxylate cotransporter [Channa argus]
MTGDSVVAGSFVAADYVVFALMLAISAAVGVYYAWADRGQKSSRDFLMGGRRLTFLPISLSLTASFMSAITVLSNPAEVYRYGASIGFYGFSYLLTMMITSEIYLPVFYRLAITSTYEYLELRFNRATRLLGTLLFLVQTVLYTGIVIYAPALALNQVTGMNLWGAVISTGVVCTFYCTMGGLKAVVWTDVFQVGVMLAGFLSVIIRSVVLQGGILRIISDSQQGGRLNFWDFDLNPLKRHTFWTTTIGGTFVWVSIYGINQAQVQRYISCKNITNARLSLYLNLLGLCSILLCSVFAGMCLYSIYKTCDPWTAGLVSAPDQLMPYLVMDILGDYPGLPGLFVAAAFSGSLSTVSSSINALAAVTVEDLIKPYFDVSEKHLSWISKGLSLVYGVLCIGMAGLASFMGGILQAVISIFGIIGGPLLGMFTLGILCPFANSKGALSGLISGLVISLWVSIGAQMYPPPLEMTRPLLLTTEGCNFTAPDSLNWTSTDLPTQPTIITSATTQNTQTRPLLADSWYSLSYLYFSPIGTMTAISVGLIVSLFTGGCGLRVGSKLTLMKEDTTFYHLFKFFKGRVKTRTGELDLTKNREEKCGNMNPAFCDVELNLTKSINPK